MYKAIALVLLLILPSCANEKYYDAVSTQNETIQLNNHIQENKDRAARNAHEEKMTKIAMDATAAASKTEDRTDDVLVPMLIMVLSDKYQTTTLLTASTKQPQLYQQIEAPEKVSDIIKAGGNVLLGDGALYMGINSTNKLAEVAADGMKYAGVHITGDKNVTDSYKTATDNVITGDKNSLTGGDTGNKKTAPEEPEESEEFKCGGCSVESWENGDCTCEEE